VNRALSSLGVSREKREDFSTVGGEKVKEEGEGKRKDGE